MTSTPDLPPPLPTRVAARAARASSLTRLVLLIPVVSLLAACAAASSAPTAHFGEADSATPGVTSSPTTRPIPDQLADPGIGPGDCKVLIYTPPGATDALPGELCRPKTAQRDVAVIVVHGGSGIGGSYANMRRWANRYLVEGYVTFLPEYHLFNPGGESPVFPRPEQNIKAAAQYLRGVGNALGIRKDRIVVQGQSAGARIGAVAFASPDELWYTGPDRYDGISDTVNGFIGFYHPYDGTMQYADQYFGGPEQSTDPLVRKRLDEADALAHANRAGGPALFITGSEDWNIIDQQQDAFAQILTSNGFASTSVIIDSGGHGFDEGGERLSKLGEESAVVTLKWLNDTFPQTPGRDAQSADADVANAPTFSGVPPTTYQARPAPSGGYSTYKNTTPSTNGNGNGNGANTGGQTSTTMAAATTTTPAVTTPTASPVVTTTPTTVVTPSTSTKPTTPPTTAPATTQPPAGRPTP